MWKFLGLAILLSFGLWGYQRYGPTFTWYTKFYHTSLIGKRFYATYAHISKDIPFQPDLPPSLDVYSPPTGSDHPVLIYIHGGGWYMYDKVLFAPVAMKLLPEKMVVVIPDYTLHPQADYEQMTHDVAAALSWTLENIDRYRGDPKRVIVAGHSAGGHLATLAVMDRRFLAAYGHNSAELSGLIGLSGVYDIKAQDAFELTKGHTPSIMRQVMRGHENFARTSPMSYVRADLPPVLLIHGDRDTTVPLNMAIDFQAVLEAAGAQSALKIYAGADHTDFLFDALAEERARIVADLAHFVHQAERVST